MRRPLLAVAVLIGIALPPAGEAGAQAPAGPALETDVAALDASVSCPDAFAHLDRDPVLLVHGTGTTSEESWPWSLGAVLPAEGYDVCTVDLPERAMVDQQRSAEHVVHAVRVVRARLAAAGSDRQVDVVGHSQGTLEPRWALRWWPDVRAAVDELVQLAPPNQGTSTAAAGCQLGSCAPAVWQMAPGSAYLAALNTDDPVPAEVDITAVATTGDELVQPSPAAAALPGATLVVVQDLCPGRVVAHVPLLADAVAVAVVLDALGADGPADPARIDPAVCRQVNAPGTDPVAVTAGSTQLYANAAAALVQAAAVTAEPPLRPYAQASAAPAPAAPDPPPAAPAGGGAAPPPARPSLPSTGGAGVPVPALLAGAVGLLGLAVLRPRT